MDQAGLAVRFEEQRPRLRAVAYRMLGSHAEADDAVQNAWLRLSGADTAEVANLAGWLTTVVARECLKMLRTRRNRREEPLADITAAGHDAGDPEAEALLADAVGPALMVVLDSLAPAERLAFVLHDVFAVPFGEIAAILGRSPAATRQLTSRARRRVAGATPPRHVDIARQRRVVEAFLAALRHGDLDGLLAVLDPDVLLRDGDTGLARGARAVGAHALTFSRAARFVRPALVGGTVGLAIVPGGRLIGALGFTFDHDRIVVIELIGDPGRLRQVDLAAVRP
ncbi:sigma-70 family RNA polymerase sigma factor [Microbispora bryophytorum]|uniref:sigma-70 family RNA polymerase sigma factor n=1 Tax=Microbispora bryophytorum TaxID=1460882 RepID=UPI00372299E1